MFLQYGRALALAALAWWAGAAQAADVVPTAQAGLAQVQAQKRAAYEAVLAQFDRAILAAPNDASIGVARCEYIGSFTDDEVGDWIEGAAEDHEACGQWLQQRWPAAPVVQLFELEQAWGEEAVARGEKLGEAVDRWPVPLRVRAYAHLADAYDDSDPELAGDYAVQAAELGHAASVKQAIEHLAAREAFEEATRLLDTVPVPENAWTATSIVRAALVLPDKQAAWRAVQRFEKGGIERMAGAVAATAQMRAGDIAGARKRLGEGAVCKPDPQLAFDIAVAARDAETALACIDIADDDELFANFGRSAVLATTMPATLFSVPMLTMAFMLCAMVAAISLFCGLVLVPVHYRGLVRRLRHLPTPPLFERASLRKAWYGLAISLCAPMLAMFVVAPGSVAAMLEGAKTSGLFGGMLWGTIAGLVCVAPALLDMSRREIIGDRSTLRAWKRVLLAWGALILVSAAITQYHRWTGGGGETLQTQMVESVVGEGSAALGGFGALLVVALLGPVFEEFVFRGLFLAGMTRHISFRWANALQAFAFALAHDDAPRFVFYFAMGLLAGWLVKSTRSLGPAIALHVLNNAVFVLLKMLT